MNSPMANKTKNKARLASSKKMPEFVVKRISEGIFILIVTSALFVLLSLTTYKTSDPGWTHVSSVKKIANAGGAVGAYIADSLYMLFGYMAYFFPLFFAYVAWIVLKDHRRLKSFNIPVFTFRLVGFILLMTGGCGLLSLEPQVQGLDEMHSAGGILGWSASFLLSQSLNFFGANLVLASLFLVGMTWATGFSWVKATERLGFGVLKLMHFSGLRLLNLLKGAGRILKKMVSREKPESFTNEPFIRKSKPEKEKKKEKPVKPEPAAVFENKPAEPVIEKAAVIEKPRKKMTSGGALPKVNLLDKGIPGKPMGGFTHQQLESLSRDMEQHLSDFGVQADVVAVHPGPVITRFELQLAAGVKVSKLSNLAKDLARSMSVTSVRVVEVIPGKTVVGLELPNQDRAMVRLSDVLSADVYQQARSPLTTALGVDIAGHPMVVDLAKMPHLLVAGTTGSGKSVGINAMILSLLFKASPDELRLILVDPKMLELSVYDGIPHLLTPVVTDMKDAAAALRWCVNEMERRYRLMAAVGVRNLAGYNTKVLEAQENGEPLTDPLWKPVDSMDETAPYLEKLPFIVVVIDELADMMMVVGKKVEQLIARIAQKARAAGIHLVLATQRPSVDVLTGLIKSNIPTRISFQVSSKIDSRTILDQQGAEQLLGHGDMLYLAPGTGTPLRVHGAFVDDDEVHRVADDWRSRGEPEYIDDILSAGGDGFDEGFDGEEQSTEDSDPLYDEAVEFVIQSRKASISAVQRRLKVGYNRAARLVEEMENRGIVGPLDGGTRDILVNASAEG